MRPVDRAAGLAFLVAWAALAAQVLVHRVVSAKLLNNYAFFVISLTMLGFACSGVLLTRWLKPVLARLNEVVSVCSAGFVISLLGVAAIFYRADLDLASRWRPQFVVSFVQALPYALAFALPFTCGGFALGALLSSRFSVRRVYFADLIGSALGAFLVIPAIRWLGVERTLLVVCLVLLAGTAWLARPRSRWARGALAVAALSVALASWARDRAFLMTYAAGSNIAVAESFGPPYGLEHVAWDPVARIEVSRVPPPAAQFTWPVLIGDDPELHLRLERVLTQNNFAFTYAPRYDGDPAELAGLERTIYHAAYAATGVEGPKALVIGVGGGIDVLTALRAGASEVTGVEVNAATLDVLREHYRDYCKAWVEDPRVRLELADGRHYLAAHDDRYDVLQLSGVDSYSGTTGAAHVFSESYLYTLEAFRLYLSRLSDDGILNVMRLEYEPPREMLRALVTAVTALRMAGIGDPSRHLAVVSSATGSRFVSVLVKKTPFNPAEVQRLEVWCEANPLFDLLAAPGRVGSDVYSRFLRAGEAEQAAAVASSPFDIRPVTDDRPFFFRYSYWWHIFPSDPVVWGWTPVMEYSLLLLGLTISLVTVLCVWAPLRFLAGRARLDRGTARYAMYFAGCGLGYLAVEMALLQRFGLFLGHPNYALSVVLASLLGATGVGALASGAVVSRLRGVRVVSWLLAGLIVVEHELASEMADLAALSFTARVAICVALVAPLGFLLGVFLPEGLERLKRTAPEFVPWAWGTNGVFSVLAPVLAVGCSITWGASALFLAAIPIYLGVGYLLPDD